MVSASSPIACARFSSPTGPPENFSITASSSLRSMTSSPSASTSSSLSAASAIALLPPRRRAGRRAGDLARALLVQRHLQEPGGAPHDRRELLLAVELEPHHDAE